MRNLDNIKIIFLGAGFGERLSNGIRSLSGEEFERYRPYLDTSKLLVKINGAPVIDYNLDKLGKLPDLRIDEQVFLVTNHLHYPEIIAWAQSRGFPTDNIIDNGAIRFDKRKGAVGDLHDAARDLGIEQHLIVIAGDCIYDIDFEKLFGYFDQAADRYSVITYYKESPERMIYRGAITLDGDNRVLRLEEKVPHPTSTLAAVPLYYLNSAAVGALKEFIRIRRTYNLRDSMGDFIGWLASKERQDLTIKAFPLPGKRYDIGNLEDLKATERKFINILKNLAKN